MESSRVGTRLNKFISDTGICSRREADELIDEHQVKINGKIANTGMLVYEGDQVTVKGKLLKPKPRAVYIAYNKPVGITCTTDREVVGNIIDAVNYRGRIFPIGRLDKPSEGLIFLTNDGDIVNKILRGGNAHEKEYIVSVDKPITEGFVKKMAAGVPILGTITKPCKVRQISPNTFNIILTQGLNRQIRRMAEVLGYNVTKLKRTRIMNVKLGDLPLGQWRELNSEEMKVIEGMLQGSSKTAEPRKPKPKAKSSYATHSAVKDKGQGRSDNARGQAPSRGAATAGGKGRGQAATKKAPANAYGKTSPNNKGGRAGRPSTKPLAGRNR